MSAEAIAYLDKMAAIGVGKWVELENGAKKFAYGTEEAFADAANAAGTAAEEWENTYDWLWNLNEEISVTTRAREKAERAYERAVKSSTASVQDLVEATRAELAALEEEARL
jgi:hypothetical protein